MSFDPKIGWALVLALALESAAVFTWTGDASARLRMVEQRLQAESTLAERMATMEAQLLDARASLERIERRLDAQR